MQLKVIGSSSAGNCYLLYNKNECLIIELGFKFNVIKQALNFDYSKVVGALVTHIHGDHAKGVRETLMAGIDVYTSQGTIEALGYNHHRLNTIKHGKAFRVGNFEILPFDTNHDCPEPLGFLIRHPDTGLIAFMTDLQYSPYVFPGLNHVLVEANYCEDILKRRAAAAQLHKVVEDRVIKSHMSIKTCLQLLAENDLSKVINIVLLHLSEGNSDAASFKKQVEAQTGRNTYIADKGMVINLSLNPF